MNSSRRREPRERYSSVLTYHTDKGQAPEKVRHINAITHHKHIVDGKAGVIGLDLDLPLLVLVQQNAGMDGRCAARCHQVGGERHRAAGIKYVVDNHDGPATDIFGDIAGEIDRARALGFHPVTRQCHEIDRRAHAGAVEGTQQIGSEDEASLQDHNNQQIVGQFFRNILCEDLDTLCDRLGVEDDVDLGLLFRVDYRPI